MELAIFIESIKKYISISLLTVLVGCSSSSDDLFWQSPTTLDTANGLPTQPQVAVDKSGNIVTLWQESTNTQVTNSANQDQTDLQSATHLYARRYNAGADTWEVFIQLQTGIKRKVKTLSTNNTTTPSIVDYPFNTQPQITLDDIGNAIAVWQQINAQAITQVYYAHYSFTDNIWSKPTTFNTSKTNQLSPQVIAEPNGHAMAIWLQWETTSNTYQVYASRYTNTTGWNDPESISQSNDASIKNAQSAIDRLATLSASTPRLTSNRNGVFLAVWQQSQYTAVPILVTNNGTIVNHDGSPVIEPNKPTPIFERYLQTGIYARRFRSNEGWDTGNASLVSNHMTTTAESNITQTDNASFSAPALSMNSQGETWVIWHGADDKHYTVQYTYDATINVVSRTIEALQIDSDDNTLHIWANHFSLDANSTFQWGNATTLQSDLTSTVDTDERQQPAIDPQISIDEQGNAMAVWLQLTQYTSLNTKWNNATQTRLWSNFYSKTTNNWGIANTLDEDNRLSAASPYVKTINHRFVVIWQRWRSPIEAQGEGSGYEVYSRIFLDNVWSRVLPINHNSHYTADLSVSRPNEGRINTIWVSDNSTLATTQFNEQATQ